MARGNGARAGFRAAPCSSRYFVWRPGAAGPRTWPCGRARGGRPPAGRGARERWTAPPAPAAPRNQALLAPRQAAGRRAAEGRLQHVRGSGGATGPAPGPRWRPQELASRRVAGEQRLASRARGVLGARTAGRSAAGLSGRGLALVYRARWEGATKCQVHRSGVGARLSVRRHLGGLMGRGDLGAEKCACARSCLLRLPRHVRTAGRPGCSAPRPDCRPALRALLHHAELAARVDLDLDAHALELGPHDGALQLQRRHARARLLAAAACA
jgi:hypothetical protein